ncbi:SDR family oxidoreductase [Enterococcus sp. LJL98]
MKDKVAFVTGSATGLGKMTAIALAKKGAHVAINYVHSQSEAQATVAYLQKEYGVQALAVQGDMGKAEDVARVVAEIETQLGAIAILVHNAGPFVGEKKTLSAYDFDEWHRMIAGNLDSAFYLLKATLPAMQTAQWGRVVFLGFDRVGQAPAWKHRAAYAAAKSGLASLMRTLALEEAPNQITMNMVCPGDIVGGMKEATISAVKQQQPRPEVGEDIARTIAFLCENDSDKISGTIIEVTGGRDILAKRNQ